MLNKQYSLQFGQSTKPSMPPLMQFGQSKPLPRFIPPQAAPVTAALAPPAANGFKSYNSFKGFKDYTPRRNHFAAPKPQQLAYSAMNLNTFQFNTVYLAPQRKQMPNKIPNMATNQFGNYRFPDQRGF